MLQTYKNVLPQLPLLSGIAETDIFALLQCLGAYIKTYKKNDFICRAGEETSFVGVVLTGRLYLIKEFYHGKTSLYKCYEPYDSFGESVICGQLHISPLTVKAAKDSTVLCLPLGKLLTQCTNECPFHSQLIENLLQITARQNINLLDKFAITAKKTIRERLLTYLIQLSRRQKSKSIVIPMSKTSLAAYLDVDRAALSREIKHLQEEECLIVDKNTFTLLHHFH